MERKWLKEVQALQELKRNEGQSSPAFKRGVAQLKRIVFRELCEKTNKDACDPAYCTPRYVNSCQYLKVWNDIEKRLGL